MILKSLIGAFAFAACFQLSLTARANPPPEPGPYDYCQPLPVDVIGKDGRLALPADNEFYTKDRLEIDPTSNSSQLDYTFTVPRKGMPPISNRGSVVVQSERVTTEDGKSVLRPKYTQTIIRDQPLKGKMTVMHVELDYLENGQCRKGKTTTWEQSEKGRTPENAKITSDPALCRELLESDEALIKAGTEMKIAGARSEIIRRQQQQNSAAKYPVPGRRTPVAIDPKIVVFDKADKDDGDQADVLIDIDANDPHAVSALVSRCDMWDLREFMTLMPINLKKINISESVRNILATHALRREEMIITHPMSNNKLFFKIRLTPDELAKLRADRTRWRRYLIQKGLRSDTEPRDTRAGKATDHP